MTDPAVEASALPGPAAPPATPSTCPPSLWQDESGQDLIEYGLAAFLLSLCAVAALNGVGNKVVSIWAGIVTSYSNAM